MDKYTLDAPPYQLQIEHQKRSYSRVPRPQQEDWLEWVDVVRRVTSNF